jgi:hypothetical protein
MQLNAIHPLAYASEYVLQHVSDTISSNEFSSSFESCLLSRHKLLSYLFCSKLPFLFDHICKQQSMSMSTIDAILAIAVVANKTIRILLQTALISGPLALRAALIEFKLLHGKEFVRKINQMDEHSHTLLWYLVIAGLYTSVEELHRILLIDLNVNTKCGRIRQTILHHTVHYGRLAELRLLLDIGVDVNQCDCTDRTVLHYVALYGHIHENSVSIAKLLIDYGASTRYKCKRMSPGDDTFSVECDQFARLHGPNMFSSGYHKRRLSSCRVSPSNTIDQCLYTR